MTWPSFHFKSESSELGCLIWLSIEYSYQFILLQYHINVINHINLKEVNFFVYLKMSGSKKYVLDSDTNKPFDKLRVLDFYN